MRLPRRVDENRRSLCVPRWDRDGRAINYMTIQWVAADIEGGPHAQAGRFRPGPLPGRGQGAISSRGQRQREFAHADRSGSWHRHPVLFPVRAPAYRSGLTINLSRFTIWASCVRPIG